MKKANIEVVYVDSMGSDLSVVNAARVSFDKESEWLPSGAANDYEGVVYQQDSKNLSQPDAKLIKYLAKHKHKSPFNHTFITVKVKAPIYVSRQLVKHKFMPWNEESRRYIDTEPEFYFPTVWRGKAENVKQGSSDVAVPNSSIDVGYMVEYGDFYKEEDEEGLTQLCLEMYKKKLADGCSPEQARSVLPQNMMVNWMWSGTLGAMADMLTLRLDSHTQAETREVAEQIHDIILPLFPVSLGALLEYA